MLPAADLVRLVEVDHLGEYIELGDEADVVVATVGRVPIPRDLLGVLEVEDWIKDRLVLEARRERAKPRGLDET